MGVRLDPSAARAWLRILRDFSTIAVGTFILLWQTVFVTFPNPLLIGAGLLALGLPPALRLEDVFWNSRRSDEPKDDEGKDEFEDRWSHLP